MRRQVLVIWTAVTMFSVIDLLLCHRQRAIARARTV
jgi:hypothetical protein